jgi:hypothetical protein
MSLSSLSRRCAAPCPRRTPHHLQRCSRRYLEHFGACKVFVKGKMSVFTTLNSLFYWNDDRDETRRQLLMLAWRRGIAA